MTKSLISTNPLSYRKNSHREKELNGAHTPENSNYKQINNTLSNISSFSTKESSSIRVSMAPIHQKDPTLNHFNNLDLAHRDSMAAIHQRNPITNNLRVCASDNSPKMSFFTKHTSVKSPSPIR